MKPVDFALRPIFLFDLMSRKYFVDLALQYKQASFHCSSDILAVCAFYAGKILQALGTQHCVLGGISCSRVLLLESPRIVPLIGYYLTPCSLYPVA